MYYYVDIPELPSENLHPGNNIILIRYLIKKHEAIDIGTPLALIQSDGAIYQIEANGKGFLKESFFEDDASIKIGEHFASLYADGEVIPYGKPYVVLHKIEK